MRPGFCGDMTLLPEDACVLVQIQTAGIFLVGCPACNQNFKHFFCALTCSPDQSRFTNVSSVQRAPDNNETVVREVDIFVADSYGERFYNSCKVRPMLLVPLPFTYRAHRVLTLPRNFLRQFADSAALFTLETSLSCSGANLPVDTRIACMPVRPLLFFKCRTWCTARRTCAP